MKKNRSLIKETCAKGLLSFLLFSIKIDDDLEESMIYYCTGLYRTFKRTKDD